ncbi:hypothetical protein MKX50_08225 [Paenibacillus sp. FSL W8-0186]|uniref:Uncharacterized protein n=1 Tax=Paenibacillus woosongensis TaxID=307580 RepID=A0ABQ4MM20_9BACL|nr:hypothetical protein [Paenibacillus woosongensis]GIP57033.1 hypothetical protein J15TS10_08470 [Paenibacillus woosongensis]
MKKTLSIFVAILSLSLVLSSSIFASPSPRAQINEEEIRILHEQTYDLVMQGKEDLVDSQPLVKKYKEIFEQNPELYVEYLSTLDIYNSIELNKQVTDESSFTYTAKGNRVIKMPDGSFIVEHQSLKNNEGIEIKPETNTGGGVSLFAVLQDTGWQSYSASTGHNFTNDARHDFWGVWKTQELHLVTKGKVQNTYIEITSTSTVGTSAWFPGKVASQSSSIVTNNARNVESTGDYNITGVIQEITYSKQIKITTKIRLDSASGGNVSYSIRSIVEGP